MTDFQKELEDIFDIPVIKRKDDDDDEDNVYENLPKEVTSSFEEKTEEFRKQLEKAEKGAPAIPFEEVKEKKIPTESKTPEQIIKEAIPVTEKAPNIFERDKPIVAFVTSNMSTSEKLANDLEVHEAEASKKDEDIDTEEKFENTTVDTKENNDNHPVFSLGDGKKLSWTFTPPNEQLKNFFDAKKNLVSYIFRDSEELDFSELFKELRKINIKIPKNTYVPEEVISKMEEVQSHRERLKEIQLTCNRQYYRFRDAFESLKGLLIYTLPPIKPAEKRDGIVFIYLGDVLMYFSELTVLEKNTELSSKHLDNAYDCLSRQITVIQSLYQKDPDSRIHQLNNTVQESLKNNQNNVQKKKDFSDNSSNRIESNASLITGGKKRSQKEFFEQEISSGESDDSIKKQERSEKINQFDDLE